MTPSRPAATGPSGFHHVVLTVTDLARSRDWYRQLLAADPVLDEEVPAITGHHKGFHHSIFALPSGVLLALHEHPDTDRSDEFDELRPGLDHVSFGCADRAEVEAVLARLDDLGIRHAGIADDALGHGLSVRDPDGIALEFWAPRSDATAPAVSGR